MCGRQFVFGLSVRECVLPCVRVSVRGSVRACVLLERYLTKQWAEFHPLWLKKPDIALRGNQFQSYGLSLAIWDHTVLPATRHKWTRPAITPAGQAGTRFTYPGGMEGWVDLGSPIATWPGVEPTTARSQVRRPNHYATEYMVCDVVEARDELIKFWRSRSRSEQGQTFDWAIAVMDGGVHIDAWASNHLVISGRNEVTMSV